MEEEGKGVAHALFLLTLLEKAHLLVPLAHALESCLRLQGGLIQIRNFCHGGCCGMQMAHSTSTIDTVDGGAMMRNSESRPEGEQAPPS